MDTNQIVDRLAQIRAELSLLTGEADRLQGSLPDAGASLAAAAGSTPHGSFLVAGLTVFMLACFVGYYVVWRVTPALHSPLMAVTNAVSSVIIVGALIAAGPEGLGASQIMGFIAALLASVNIFGGFLVTQRMLGMFKKKIR